MKQIKLTLSALPFLHTAYSMLYVQDIHATPESRAAANFLLFSPSVRSNGMGEAGVALTDEPGAYYNPAAPAMGAKKFILQQ